MVKSNLFRFFSKKSISCLAISLLLASCGGGGSTSSDTNSQEIVSKREGDNTVVIHELADPDMLHPIISTSANATYIQSNIFQQLLAIDFTSLQFTGELAVARPEIKQIEEGEYKDGMSLTYEIRPEAVWPNGKPVLATDYIFTIKAIKNPKVQGASLRPYMEFIDDVVVDAENPKKFTVYSKQRYILAEAYSAYFVYPEYIYDAKGLMKEFSIKDLNDPKKKSELGKNPKIQEFAKEFGSPKFAREKGFVVGSGPYEFMEWETGQRITLKKKANWWGDKITDLAANPESITYKVINDQTTSITALKDEGIDVARRIRSSDFEDLKKNERIKALYNLHTPRFMSYDYFGFNMKNPKLSDKRVRRAIAHLVDTKEIIDVLLYGLGEQLVGPVHPSKSYYNNDLTPIEFNLEKAKALLDEAGWKDSDGDGVVDKMIDGEKVDMKLSYKYNSGREIRKNMGILLKENAKRVGIDINIEVREWTVYLEETKRREFDIMCLGWVQSPIPDDLKQIWHTDSDSPDGSNRVGFGDAASDKIIDDIRVTLDDAKRTQLYKDIQKIIYEEQPYVFLYAPKERIAIHGRFAKAEGSVMRPGYNEKAFELTMKAASNKAVEN